MRKLVSKLFPFTTDAVEGSERLLSRSQMLMNKKRHVERCYPGAYILNPSMYRSIRKLEAIIDKEMESIGGQRIAMPTLSPADLWKTTGRWDSIGSELFKVKDRSNSEFCIAPTHEETVCSLVSGHERLSYKSLPLLLYQITPKFRDELHPKHGLLRCREFLMKDMYTFDRDEETARETYNMVVNSYSRLFKHLALDVIKVTADTGNIGGSMSHEFHLASDIGEDMLEVCVDCGNAFNSELSQTESRNGCTKQNDMNASAEPSCPCTYKTVRGIELAHAFLLGTRYSTPLKAMYNNKKSQRLPCMMGCFGIGVTRLVAAAIEVLSDEKQMRFPRAIAPYTAVIIPQQRGYRFEETLRIGEDLYDKLDSLGHAFSGDILMDDRFKISIGRRLDLARAAGYPYAVCIGRKALDEKLIEVIDLYKDSTRMIPLEAFADQFVDLYQTSK